MTSSVAKRSVRGKYEIPNSIRLNWRLLRLPSLKTSTFQYGLFGELASYAIAAEPSSDSVNPQHWDAPPHRHFVNLRTICSDRTGTEVVDPTEMLGFARRYGLLYRTIDPRIDDPEESKNLVQFVEKSNSLDRIRELGDCCGYEEFRELTSLHSLALLKHVWRTGSGHALQAIADSIAESLQSYVEAKTGSLVTIVPDAWTLICMLILRDHASEKTAVCANPECPAPLFLKSRKTQKICEQGDCVAWAQRRYALNWWHKQKC